MRNHLHTKGFGALGRASFLGNIEHTEGVMCSKSHAFEQNENDIKVNDNKMTILVELTRTQKQKASM